MYIYIYICEACDRVSQLVNPGQSLFLSPKAPLRPRTLIQALSHKSHGGICAYLHTVGCFSVDMLRDIRPETMGTNGTTELATTTPLGQTMSLGESIGGQVDVLAPQLLKEQLGPVGHPALEKPQRERAKDEAVVAAPNPAEAHCTHGGVHPLVHIEVQEERAHGLSLARMRSDGKGRGERNLFLLDSQHWIAPLAVQVPVLLSWADRIDARLIDAI